MQAPAFEIHEPGLSTLIYADGYIERIKADSVLSEPPNITFIDGKQVLIINRIPRLIALASAGEKI